MPFSGPADGVSFIDCAPDNIVQKLRDVTEQWGADDWRILSSLKNGRAGVNSINGAFHHERSGDAFGTSSLLPGELVIHLVNDCERALTNGSLGTVVGSSESGEVRVRW